MYEIRYERIFGENMSQHKVAEKIAEMTKNDWEPFGIQGNYQEIGKGWTEYEVWFKRKKRELPPGCEVL